MKKHIFLLCTTGVVSMTAWTQTPLKPVASAKPGSSGNTIASQPSNGIVSPRSVTPVQNTGNAAVLKGNAPAMVTGQQSISDVIPAEGPRATAITISGQKFGNATSDVQVKINGVSAIITGVSDNQITAVVPDKAGSGPVSVSVKGKWVTGGSFKYNWAVGVNAVFAGSPGPQGNADGTGVSAGFRHPTDLARDRMGNIYVADCENNRIRKINNFGEVTTLAGSGEAGFADGVGSAAKFFHPYNITCDAAGNVYVADLDNYRVRKITPAGVVTTLAGGPARGHADGIGAAASFSYLRNGICVDPSNNVYVSDEGTIRKITPSGAVSTISKGLGAKCILIGSSNDIYFFNNQNVLCRMSLSGAVTRIAGNPGHYGVTDGYGDAAQFNGVQSLGIDAAGTLYIDEFDPDAYPAVRIRRVAKDGHVSTVSGLGPNAMGAPMGIAGDAANVIYIADHGLNCIRKITFQ